MFHLFWQNWQPHENVLNSDRMSRPLSFYFPSSSLKFAHNGFIWLFRYFWSTWLPSGYVPSGWAIQTLLRPQQSWSGGLHKLLSVSAQVGGIQQTRFFALFVCTVMFGLFLSDSKKLEKQSMVSVVADLRDVSLSTMSFIVETLLLLEVLLWWSGVCGYIVRPFQDDGLLFLDWSSMLKCF